MSETRRPTTDETAYQITPHGMVVANIINKWPHVTLDGADALAKELAGDAIELAIQRTRQEDAR